MQNKRIDIRLPQEILDYATSLSKQLCISQAAALRILMKIGMDKFKQEGVNVSDGKKADG